MVVDNRISRKKTLLLALSLVLFLLLEASRIFVASISDTNRHMISLCIFLAGIKAVNGRVSLYNIRYTGIMLVAIYFWGYFFSRMSLLELLDMAIIPLILAGCCDCVKLADRKICLFAAIFLFLLNSFVCMFEYKNGINMFYFDMNNMTRFRATGIWGHPLYSAVVEASTMFFILMSDLKKMWKFIFWSLGLYVLFMNDARAAILSIVVCSMIFLYWQGFMSKKNFVYILVLATIAYFAYGYLSSSDLGGKLFTKTSSGGIDNSGWEYRVIALKILFDLDFVTLMTGVENQFTYVHKYGVICAENGFVARVLVYGLPIALMTFYLNIKLILHICGNIKKKYRYLIVAFLLVAAITNQSLLTGYIWYVYMIFFLMLRSSRLEQKLGE